MSRKARISSEEKKDWTRVRCWTAQNGYSSYKPSPSSYLHDAIVILEHQCCQDKNHHHKPMKDLSDIVQELLFSSSRSNNGSSSSSSSETESRSEPLILVVEFTSLLQIRYDDDQGEPSNDDIFIEESCQQQYGKRVEKPVVRFLQRLNLRNATVVARGTCCPFAMKLLSPSASRSLSNENVKRLVLVTPNIPSSFINQHLLEGPFMERLQKVELMCAYASNREMERRDAVLRHYCPLGTSLTWDGEVDQQHMEVLLLLLGKLQPGTQKEKVACTYDDSRYDNLGRKVFFSELTIVMDPDSKMDVQVSEHITYASMVPSEQKVVQNGLITVEDCVRECGVLILRGNRIVLCRSLDNPTMMSIPSCALDICCGEGKKRTFFGSFLFFFPIFCCFFF